MFCQLETLRHCLPPSVRRTLEELPESLDETYERVLKEIKKPNRDHARRLLQCLVVAIRPLEVKELAEVLAVDFDDSEGIPKLKPDWRWEDEEQALLTSCSSLIITVETEDSRVVQFSHFSVKEYLTSERLATSSGDTSRYHIDLEPAHTILAQACMSSLLLLEDRAKQNRVRKRSPLAKYAARYWVTHAQFERVSSLLRRPMEHLFDLDKPYFAAWLQLHDVDTHPYPASSSLDEFIVTEKSGHTTLYYAALLGFQDLVEHLVVKYPQHVNASGGYYVTPLVAALARGHFPTVEILHRNGAQVNVRSPHNGTTPLASAAQFVDLEMVQILLDYKADVNAQTDNKWTSLHHVSHGPWVSPPHKPQLLPEVARLLLENGADVNARDDRGWTPLHVVANSNRTEVVPVLLAHGANIGAEGVEGSTPLHVAAMNGRIKAVRVLLEHGANVDPEDKEGRTPLHRAAIDGQIEVVQLLLEHGANVGLEDKEGRTPMHLVMDNARTLVYPFPVADHVRAEVARVLLEHGAKVDPEDKEGRTMLHRAAENGTVELIHVLLEHGANVDAVDGEGRSPLHLAVHHRSVEIVRALLERGANIGAEDREGRTPLHLAGRGGIQVEQVLLEHGANVHAEDNEGRTPLHSEEYYEWVPENSAYMIRMLLEHGADVGAEDDEGRTPLHIAVHRGSVEVVRVLLEHGANVGAEDDEGRTPFQINQAPKVYWKEHDAITKLLLEHGPNVVL